MATSRVAISIDQDLLAEVDGLVAQHLFANRSQVVQTAVRDKIARIKRSRLAEECAKLDPAREKSMAEEGMARESAQWPEY
jgi:metal-responsive CopG/Arc/MetJ family transcriptional regulator